MKPFIGIILATTLAASIASGQWVESIIHLPDSINGTSEVYGLAYDSLTNSVYAVGYGATTVIDASTHGKIARLPYSGAWVACDPARRRLYICGDSVYVLDAQTHVLLHAIPAGVEWSQMTAPAVLCTAYRKLYVARRDSVAVIDTRGDSLVRFIRTHPLFGLYYAEAEGKLYCSQQDGVLPIDCSTDSVGTAIPLSGACWSPSTYNPLSRRLYHGSLEGMYVIDCRADTLVKVIAPGSEFSYLFCDPRANRVYALLDIYAVAVVDCSSDSLVAVIPHGDARSGYYSSGTNRYYSLDEDMGGAIVDCARDTLVGYFSMGVGHWFGPFCENPGANEVYCGDREHGLLTVLDGAGDSVKAWVITSQHYGVGPLRYDAARNRVDVLDRYIGGLSGIDAGSNTLERTSVVAADPEELAYNGVEDKLYTIDRKLRQVVAIAAQTETVAALIHCPGLPRTALCVNVTADKVFCAAWSTPDLWSIDSRVDSVSATIPLPFYARVLKSSPDAAKVYITDGEHAQVLVVDAGGDSILRTVAISQATGEMGYSPTQRHWYCFGRDSVFVLDADSDSLVASASSPGSTGIGGPQPVWNKETDRLYCDAFTSGGHLVVAFDCATNQVLGTLDAEFVRGCDTVRNRVYCTDDSALLVYDGANDSLVARVPVPTPGYLTLNPANGRAYLGSGYSDVYVIRDPSGVAEARGTAKEGWKNPAIVRGVLYLRPSPDPLPAGEGQGVRVRSELLDATGRTVLELQAGANDVRHLAPGVYFVRQGAQAQAQAQAVRKVVVTR